MTPRKPQPEFKDDGLITSGEASHMIKIYHQYMGKTFVCSEVRERFNMSYAFASNTIRAAVALGVLKIKSKADGGKPGVYYCAPGVNVEKIATERIRKNRDKPTPYPSSTKGCMLADVLGYSVIDHQCNPRVVINDFKGGKIERTRPRVYVGSNWMEGM